jgi:hypothetical protein
MAEMWKYSHLPKRRVYEMYHRQRTYRSPLSKTFREYAMHYYEDNLPPLLRKAHCPQSSSVIVVLW